MTMLEVNPDLKALREALCLAQHALVTAEILGAGHASARIGELINEIDRHRPLGSDGKHGNRHTDSCGCIDKGNLDELEHLPASEDFRDGVATGLEMLKRRVDTVERYGIATGAHVTGELADTISREYGGHIIVGALS